MSSDNYYLVRIHPEGGFGITMGFASDNYLPEVTATNEIFDSIEDALLTAASEYPEYGVEIHPECYDGIAEGVTPKAYTELGQWVFSNGQVQEYECDWATDGLILLSEIIAEVRGAIRGRYGFGELLASNSGAAPFENDTFVMRTYCWCDGEILGHEIGCPPNFEHKPSGLQISWYKNAERGVTANQSAPTAICWWRVLNECVESIERTEQLTDITSVEPTESIPYPPTQCRDCVLVFTPYRSNQERCFLCEHRPPQKTRK